MQSADAFRQILKHGEYRITQHGYLYVGINSGAVANLDAEINLLKMELEPADGDVFDGRFSEVYCTEDYSDWMITSFHEFFSRIVKLACIASQEICLDRYFFHQIDVAVAEKASTCLSHWYSFLHSVCNHSTEQDGLSGINFWLTASTHDNTVKSHIIKFSSDELDFDFFCDHSMSCIVLSNDDPHLGEKTFILRKVISKHFPQQMEISLKELLLAGALINDAYQEEFEGYVSKFGLDKSLDEIMDQRLKLVDSITKSSLDVKAKFLAAPAVMLATLLLRSSDASFFALLIILGVTFFILKSMSKTARQSMELAEKGAFRLLDNIKSDGINEKAAPLIQKKVAEEKETLGRHVREIAEGIDAWTTVIALAFVVWLLLHLFT